MRRHFDATSNPVNVTYDVAGRSLSLRFHAVFCGHQARAMDPVVLSYHDSLLRRSDASLLDGPHWLNDRVIGFAFQYFAADRFRCLGDAAAFISPEVTQFIKCASCPEELSVFLEPLALWTRRWVFLAVNDHGEPTAGGSHWSLLVFHRAAGRFAHYDSQSGSNAAHARRIAAKLGPFVDRKPACVDRKPACVEEACPAQQNSYDCGMYVISITEALCSTPPGEAIPAHIITPAYITQKRAEWSRLIQSLNQNQNLCCTPESIDQPSAD